jgi:phosphomannomutase/phosphoglucomutase
MSEVEERPKVEVETSTPHAVGSQGIRMGNALPRFHLSKAKVPLPRVLRDRTIARVRIALRARADRLVTADGVKAFFPDGWLLVRPSGTEPTCRVLAEARTPDRSRALMDAGIELVRTASDQLADELFQLA